MRFFLKDRTFEVNKLFILLASGSEAATILYNSEICPKSVGCKIADLRSRMRMRSLYPGACEFGDMRSRFLYIRDMLVNARGNIDRFRATAVIKDTLNEASFYLDACCLWKDSSRS